MKCNESRPGFELVSPSSFPTTITITPRAPPSCEHNYTSFKHNIKKPLNITLQPLNITLQLFNITLDPLNLTLHPLNINLHPLKNIINIHVTEQNLLKKIFFQNKISKSCFLLFFNYKYLLRHVRPGFNLWSSQSRLTKWYLIPSCLTLSIIRDVSRVKWNNPGKGVAPSLTSRRCSYWKGTPQIALD